MSHRLEEFTVVCFVCGQMSEPPKGSPNWWRAKKHAKKGFIDALMIDGKSCGCIKKEKDDAPYRVFGYADDLVDFEFGFDRFTEAVKACISASDNGCVVFIQGVSNAVKDRIDLLHP